MPRHYPPIPSITDHALYQPVRSCTLCPLHQTCIAPVPPVGPSSPQIMFVAESPAKWEVAHGIPLTGPTWLEMSHYLDVADLDRDMVWISNTQFCPRPGLADPRHREAVVCWDNWKGIELDVVRPRILVVMGQLALQCLLHDSTATVVDYHGFPFEYQVGSWSGWVLSTYHPSAGIHGAAYLKPLHEDFEVLRELKIGVVKERPVDAWRGKEVYSWLPTGPSLGDVPYTGVDTESVGDSLWCVGVSNSRGSGFIVKPEHVNFQKYSLNAGELIFHNSLYDLPLLIRAGIALPDKPIHDTYVMAKLLQEDSLGLKALSRRHLGMEMHAYMDVVGPQQRRISLEYLIRALDVAVTLPKPQPVSEVVTAERGLAIKIRKPQRLDKKIAKLVNDLEAGKVNKEGEPVDAIARWKEWGEEVGPVEAALGSHPVASLADVDSAVAVRYAARDPDATLRLFHVLKKDIERAGLSDAYWLDMAAIPMVAQMEASGIVVDRERLIELSHRLGRRLIETEAECWDLAGSCFNPQSSDQTAHVLYDRMGLKPRRYTDGGAEGTQDDDILPYRLEYPIVGKVIEYRRLLKLKTTYADPYLEMSKADGRVRCSYGFSQTMRFQGREPNLSAIPNHAGIIPLPEAAELRNCFIPSTGMVFSYWDMGQAEMRALAHLSQDAEMVRCFLANEDIHTKTAMDVFGVDEETVRGDEDRWRYPMKKTGFSVVYGVTGMGLHRQFEQEMPGVWQEQECYQFIEEYLKARPGVKKYMSETIALGRRTGEVRSLMGHRLLCPELRSPNYKMKADGERRAINFPVQCSAVEIIKVAMGRILRERVPATWLLQEHDALTAEVWPDDLERVQKRVKDIIESAVELSVPVVCQTKSGVRLGDLH